MISRPPLSLTPITVIGHQQIEIGFGDSPRAWHVEEPDMESSWDPLRQYPWHNLGGLVIIFVLFFLSFFF
jgi:hypothetical protein